MQPLSRDFLSQQAGQHRLQETGALKPGAFDMEAFIQCHGLGILRRKDWNGGTVYELTECPFDTAHKGGSAALTLSGDGTPGFTCKHNGCFGKSIRDVFVRFPAQRKATASPVWHDTTSRETWSIASLPSVWSLDVIVTWLVDDLLPEGAVTLWTGDSGVGKSTVALALCGAVAHGETFLGRKTARRPVLYVDRENPLAVVRERLGRLGISETLDLKIWGGWVDPAPDAPSSLAILTYAREHRPLIVFDSLVAFHSGSEQDASETRRHMQLYRDLASLGATVLLLHHTGKAESARQYRGSSDIKAAVDGAWLLESLSDTGGGIQSLRLTPFKSRIALAQPIRMECVDGRFEASAERSETNREVIERLIQGHPESCARDLVTLARDAGLAKQRAEQLLTEGERHGWLTVDVGPRNRKTYRLTEVEVEI